MIHQIFAYGVVTPGLERDLELGADPVGGTDQYRMFPPGEQIPSAEAADIGEHVASERAPRMLSNLGYGTIGLVDVDARVFVTNPFFQRRFTLRFELKFYDKRIADGTTSNTDVGGIHNHLLKRVAQCL